MNELKWQKQKNNENFAPALEKEVLSSGREWKSINYNSM